MSDMLMAKGADSKFRPHPDGQFVAQCVDTIDLGDRVEDFVGKPRRLTHKCALVFRTGEVNEETGELIDVAREFTVSMSEKANLRRFLEQWRGRAYTPEQIEAGVPLHKLTGNYGLLTVSQTQSRNGRTYASIAACVGVPAQMRSALPQFPEYKRADFWETRKKEYAEGAQRFRAEMGAPPSDFDEMPPHDDDDLPF